MGGMGFRDFYVFNLTFLAKKVWPLIQFPQSLLAQLLKAKYFANENILSVELKKNASYTWYRMFKARRILKEGFADELRMGSQFRCGRIIGFQGRIP